MAACTAQRDVEELPGRAAVEMRVRAQRDDELGGVEGAGDVAAVRCDGDSEAQLGDTERQLGDAERHQERREPDLALGVRADDESTLPPLPFGCFWLRLKKEKNKISNRMKKSLTSLVVIY